MNKASGAGNNRKSQMMADEQPKAENSWGKIAHVWGVGGVCMLPDGEVGRMEGAAGLGGTPMQEGRAIEVVVSKEHVKRMEKTELFDLRFIVDRSRER